MKNQKQMRRKTKKIIRITQMLLALLFVILLQIPVEAKAATVTMSFKEVVIVKTEDGTKCGNFGCIALDGKGGLYALKTDTTEGTPNYSILYYFADYKNYKNTKSCVKYKVNQSLGHGNGMTYRSGKLYVADGQKIIKMSTKGVVEATYGIDLGGVSVGLGSISASSITYYKSDTYIVGVGKIGEDTNRKNVYVIGSIEGSKFMVKGSFKVKISDKCDMNQDICYGNSCLYIVTSQKANPIVNNKIFCVTSFGNGQTVNPTTIIEVKKPDLSMYGNEMSGKFEAEGIAIESDGTIVLGANCTEVNDGVFVSIN